MITIRFTPATGTALAAVVFSGAIFGFFYAWACSTLWGLDTIDPRAAIEAMQGMNASVQNPIFFAGFFLTPVVTGLAGVLALSEGRRTMAALLLVSAGLSVAGSILWTATMNLPLNEGLAAVGVPTDIDQAREIWQEYSREWKNANLFRTVVTGITLTLAGAGLLFSQVSQRSRTPAVAPHGHLQQVMGNNSATSQR